MVNQLPPPGKLEMNKPGILQAFHMAAGKVNIAVVTQDYGVADAVTTTILDSSEVDGEVLAAFLINTELAAGSTDAGQTWLKNGSTQASEKSANKNVLSAVTAVPQHGTESNRQFDRGDTISVYTEAESGRSAGMYFVVMLWKER